MELRADDRMFLTALLDFTPEDELRGNAKA
jgi:hypothetical protein